MDDDHGRTGAQHAANCRWARPTVQLPYPAWLEAEAHPWSCLRLSDRRALESTGPCEMCPNWIPKRLALDRPARD